MNIHVAIVNSDRRTLDGLAALIRTTPGLHLGAICETGRSALVQLKLAAPHVVLIEPNLQDLPTYWGILRLRAVLPGLLVIVVARDLSARGVQMAVAAGAHGLVSLSSPPARLMEAIFEVASGGAWIDPKAARILVERLHLDPGGVEAIMDLTRREEEVLDGYARGFRAKEVAARLQISTFTVQTHIRSIYTKLGARSAAHAIARYHPLGRFSTGRWREDLGDGSPEGGFGSRI